MSPIALELTLDSNLVIPADIAKFYFPSDAMAARLEGPYLVLYPLLSTANGGLLLKVRNLEGMRTVCLSELLQDVPLANSHSPRRTLRGTFDSTRHALVFDLGESSC